MTVRRYFGRSQQIGWLRLRNLSIAASALAIVSACSAPNGVADGQATVRNSLENLQSGSAQPRVKVVTRDQYYNTLAYVFGPDVRPEVDFSPLERVDGLLQLGASRAGINDTQLELFQRTAQLVSRQVVSPVRRDYVISCKPVSEKGADDNCAREVLSRVGRLMYGRPLSEEKISALAEKANSSAITLQDFYSGLGAAIEGILLSPKSMMVIETAEADPRNPGAMRLDAYSLASRLSYFLWNAGPDEALLKAAASGELYTERGLAKSVDRMLSSPRLKDGVRAFFDDMFGFEKLLTLSKDPEAYPSFTGLTAEDSREQTLRTVVELLVNRREDYRNLYTSRVTYVSPALAALYQMPAAQGWTEYEFPEGSPRVGLLSHVSFLAANSHPARSSATLRGKALRELLLCQPVPIPPGNVDFSALENPSAEFKTARDRINFHLENPVCAGCHRITDPIGLSLENFDGSGRYREAERGVKIDASGALDGTRYEDVAGLGKALHDHPALPACLVKRVYAYGTGSPTTNADAELLRNLNERFAAAGYQFPQLMRTIALSPAFSQFKAEALKQTASDKHSPNLTSN